jgi:hypothetical protein
MVDRFGVHAVGVRRGDDEAGVDDGRRQRQATIARGKSEEHTQALQASVGRCVAFIAWVCVRGFPSRACVPVGDAPP